MSSKVIGFLVVMMTCISMSAFAETKAQFSGAPAVVDNNAPAEKSFSNGSTVTAAPVLTPEEQKLADAKAAYTTALIDMNHGYKNKAVANFLKAAELNPKSVNVRLMLGDLYADLDKHMLAIEQYRFATALDPTSVLPRLGVMSCYIAMGLVSNSVKEGEDAIKSGIPAEQVAGGLGWSYYMGGDLDSAEKYFRIEKDKVKDDTGPINNLGLTLFRKGNYAEALENFKEAELLNTASIVIPYFKAVTYLKLGKEADATDSVREGIKKDPQFELKSDSYKKQFFMSTDPGDLTSIFAKIKAEVKPEVKPEATPEVKPEAAPDKKAS